MNELSVLGVMRSLVPITRFNKGEANRIFDEVESGGTKIVMKNNRPACVLISPSRYEALMEMLSDYILQEEAEARITSFASEETISHEELIKSLGITEDDLADVDVEIE